MPLPRTNFAEAAEDPRFRNAFRGYLAEDYDGLAQFVSVALNRSSTSVALRARVPYGNAGSAGHYPTGTPLVLYAHRGRVEVIHGLGVPKALAVNIRAGGPVTREIDLFGRAQVGSWGTPTRGAPDWVTVTDTDSGTPTPANVISVSGAGNLGISCPRPATFNGGDLEQKLILDELRDAGTDKFRLEFNLTFGGLRGTPGTETINEFDLGILQSALGLDGIYFQIRWLEFVADVNQYNITFRDRLGSVHGNYVSPGAYLVDSLPWSGQKVVIDRDVSRGTTQLILQGIGTVEVNCSTALARASYPLSVRHSCQRVFTALPFDTVSGLNSVMQIDEIYLTTVE